MAEGRRICQSAFMGTTAGSLRARKKAATEAALQDAALALFARKGYDATTIEEIVADADVSRRTFFRYFGSKEEVVFKGTENDIDAFRELLMERPPEETDVEALKSAVIEFLNYLERRKAPILEFVEVVLASATLRARAAELEGRWTTGAAEGLSLRAGSTTGAGIQMKHRLLAAMGVAVLIESIQLWTRGHAEDAEEAVRDAFKTIEDGSILQ
jgi:AcrR family transcriptional regulator